MCFKVFQWALLILAITGISFLCVVNLFISCKANIPERDYAYEAFCDSIWENNPDYYLDVLVETDSFQQYVEEVGEWWND